MSQLGRILLRRNYHAAMNNKYVKQTGRIRFSPGTVFLFALKGEVQSNSGEGGRCNSNCCANSHLELCNA